MINHVKLGPHILKLAKGFPHVSLSATIQPITRTVLRVRLTITPEFDWDDKLHGMTSEPWWVWVEDAENDHMYHSEYFLLERKQVISLIRNNAVNVSLVPMCVGERERATGACLHHSNL